MPVKPGDKKETDIKRNKEKPKELVQNNSFDSVHRKNNIHKIKSAGRSVTQKLMPETNLGTVFLLSGFAQTD
jgi:hypothetical protein